MILFQRWYYLATLFLIVPILMYAQPANDNFASATDVTALINSCSADAAYTSTAATADQSKGSCWSNGPNRNVWFKFTASATTYMKVQLKVGGVEGTLQNPFLALWDVSLTQLACQNFISATTDTEVSYLGLTPGDTYYISVDAYAGYQGSFSLCLSDVIDYNYYEGAEDVTSQINGCSANAAYTTLLAGPDRAKGSCWANGPNRNVWFKFTAPASTYIKVQLKVGGVEGTLQNPFLALWDASLTQLACQNYISATTDTEVSYLGLTPGDTYYISVDAYAGYQGSFSLCLSDVIDYNYYEGAEDVTSLINSCSANAAYTTLLAGPDRAKGSCWVNGPNRNVWFKFTASATTYMKVQLKVGGVEGTLQNPFLALWDASLTQLACQNYISATTDTEVSYLGLTPGDTYYISVDAYAGYQGSFSLCLSDVIDYNYYEAAEDVTSLINSCSANAAYTTLLAGPDRAKGSCWANGPNRNVWFKFTAPASTYIKVQLKVGGAEGTMQNPFLALWDASLTQLACQNYISATTDTEVSYLGLTPGDTYYISVDAYAGYQGSFSLCLSDVIDYNYYEAAEDVTSLINSCSTNAAYTTLLASPDRAKGSCWANGPNRNVWFKFTASATTYMKVQLKVGGVEGTLQNPFLALWDASLTQLACQNYISATTDIEVSYLGLVPGNTYYISADAYVSYQGSFTLCLSDVIDYNYYEAAEDVTSLINSCSANAAYTTLLASPDRAKGSCWANGPNRNVWFKFTASATTYMKVQLKVGGAEGTMQNPFLALWDASLTQLACQNYISATTDIEVSYLGLVPGNTYYISADAYVSYQGSFTLCLSDVVDYNFYEGATDVTSQINGCSANAAYTTLLASPDRAKGSCWANGPNRNVWFKFTAPASTYIKVQLKVGGAEGTMQNPFLALWDASLTQLACQNYISATTDIEVSYLGLVPGNTYYISADAYVGYQGSFTLCLSDVVDYNYYEGAEELTNLNNWCSANAAYTTLLATPDKSKGTCWNNGPNNNRWFKFVAITPNATIQMKTGGAEGTLLNAYMALWESDGTTQIACTRYVSASSDLSISLASLVPGNTYYISCDNYVGYAGSFTLCIDNIGDTYYSRANGTWNDPNNWSIVGYGGPAAAAFPTAGDVANIQDNDITVNSNQAVAEVNMTVSTASSSLVIDNCALTVNGAVSVTNNLGVNFPSIVTVQNNGSMFVNDVFLITRSGGDQGIGVTVNAGSSLTVNKDFDWINLGGTVSSDILNASGNVTVNRDLALISSGSQPTYLNFNNASILTIGRDLTFLSTSSGVHYVNMNNTSQLRIKRNLVRGATPFGNLTFASGASLTFNGTGNTQNFLGNTGSGGDGFNYTNVVINNTSGFLFPIVLTGAVTITGSMTFTDGVVQSTSANVLTFASGVAPTLGSSISYVSGPVNSVIAAAGSTSFNIPIGKNADWRPVVLTVNHADATPVIYTSEVFNASAGALGYTLPVTVDRVSGVHYWQIDRQSVANLNDAVVTLYYGNGTSDGVTDFANLTVVKNVGAGTTWFDIGGVATGNGSGSITSDPFTSFSKFTLANLVGGANPLPVELTDFHGVYRNAEIDLTWTTKSELNNALFSIERSSTGKEFETLAYLEGAGTTSNKTNYAWTDMKPLAGLNYYRLKQTDFDGKFTYSNVIAVKAENGSDLTFVVFPNPAFQQVAKPEVFLKGFDEDTDFTMEIYTIQGKRIRTMTAHTDSTGEVTMPIQEHLVPGLYILKLRGLQVRFEVH